VSARLASLCLCGALFLGLSGAAGGAEQIHGENSEFVGHGVAMAWGILKAPVEDQSLVVLRIVPLDPSVVSVRVDGVDPFTQRRQEFLTLTALGSGLDVTTPRGTFAELTRREIHLYTASDTQARRPSLTIYFMGLPDTTPEFLAEPALRTYLDQTMRKLRGGEKRAP
jgi:hypothetical protein